MDSSNNAIRAFQGLAEAMRYPACFLDDNGIVLFSNSSANALSVFRTNTAIFESLPHSSSHILEALIEDSFSTHKEASGQFRWSHGGGFTDYLMTVTPVSVMNRRLVFVALHELTKYYEGQPPQEAADKNPVEKAPELPPPVAVPKVDLPAQSESSELELYKTLVDSSCEFMARVGKDLKVSYMNKVKAPRQVSDFIGADVVLIAPPENRNKIKQCIEGVFSSGTSATFRCTSDPSQANAIGCFDVTVVPVLGKDATVDEVVLLARDMTVHAAVEAQSKETMSLFASLLANSPAPIMIESLDGTIVTANAAVFENVGKSKEDVIGKKLREVFGAATADILRKDSKDVITSKSPSMLERTLKAEGQEKHFLVKKFPLTNAEGQVNAVGSIYLNITEQKRSQELHQTLTSLVEASKDVFAFCDLEGKPEFINRVCVETFGWSPQARSISEYMPPAVARKLFNETLPEIIKNGSTWEGESEVLNRNTGEVIPVWQKIFPLNGPNGKIRYVATTATDLRAHKVAERALSQAAKMSSLGSMAGGIAHEINNPLAIIYGKSCQIRKLASRGDISPSELVSELEKVEQTALRISRIIKGLRSFARNGDQDPRVDTPISNIIEETLTFCQERFRNHGIELSVAQAPGVAINCRAIQICQVMLNLLNNAFDAVEQLPQRWVDVNMDQEDGRIVVSVVDSGGGIPQAVVDRMMDPFFTTKDFGKGTGLGLSIAKGIIEEHGGSLYYSPLDGHTRFVITLPAKPVGKKVAA